MGRASTAVSLVAPVAQQQHAAQIVAELLRSRALIYQVLYMTDLQFQPQLYTAIGLFGVFFLR